MATNEEERPTDAVATSSMSDAEWKARRDAVIAEILREDAELLERLAKA